MASAEPSLRILIDGDSSRVYRQGETVEGRAVLVGDKQGYVEEVKVAFIGNCTTRTTRPYGISDGNSDGPSSARREHQEQTSLFNFEKVIVSDCTVEAGKTSWPFSFAFPDRTETKYSRWAHGSRYMKDPHALPPSFHALTNNPGGEALVSYYIQVKLSRGDTKPAKRCTHMLAYHPALRDTIFEPKVNTRVLYTQTWKPLQHKGTAMDRIINKVSRDSQPSQPAPRIVPTLHFPEKVAPGQHMPLILSLADAQNQPALTGRQSPQCTLDSLNVSISTCTTAICGKPFTQPQDIVRKQTTCISKQDINQPIAFDMPTKLTNNFSLVNDAECVPSFKTYTITRSYQLIVAIGLKCQGQRFMIRSTTPLEILPFSALAPSRRRLLEEQDEDVDPLPLYKARESFMAVELAPDYDSLYPPSTPSTLSPSESSHYEFLPSTGPVTLQSVVG